MLMIINCKRRWGVTEANKLMCITSDGGGWRMV